MSFIEKTLFLRFRLINPFHLRRVPLLEKQLCSPVWQAIPSFCSTKSNMVSPSQSRRISFTFWIWPDSSPLCQSFCLERVQYTASPSLKVSNKASRFIQAIIKISLLPDSWVITGTSPCSLQATASSQEPAWINLIGVKVLGGLLIAELYSESIGSCKTTYIRTGTPWAAIYSFACWTVYSP